MTGSAQEVIAHAETLGYLLEAKLLNADLAHKNHAGAVCLKIENRAELQRAIDAITASVRAYDLKQSTVLYVLFAARRRTFPDSREISAKVPDWLACDWSPSQYLPCVVRREPQLLRRLEDKALITRSMKDSNEQQN